MLSVIGSILRILGIILLSVLGIVLVLLLLILFMPIMYRAQAEKQTDLQASVKVRWLFGFLRVEFIYPEPGNLVAKVLFFKVFDSGGKTSGARQEDEIKNFQSSTQSDSESFSETTGDVSDPKIDHLNQPNASTTVSDTIPPNSLEEQTTAAQTSALDDQDDMTDFEAVKAHEAAWQEVKRKLRGEKQESKINKIKYTFHNTCDKIKDVWENVSYYKDILSENETRLLLDHVMLRIGKILKSIRPRKLSADILFGTGSPDTTGYILGAYGMLSPFIGGSVVLTPDFETAILKGTILIAGHITIARILWQGILLVLDRKLWHFIAEVKHEEPMPKKRPRRNFGQKRTAKKAAPERDNKRL
ncbi:MAG: hypothetical protein IJ794_13865 [Lachnospiraceae bacterium]|nr:hypothetical protein [Lachnospiraceae bacterium]